MANPGTTPIAALASTPVHTITADDDLDAARLRLAERGVSSLLVLGRDGLAAGVLSRRDLLNVGRVRHGRGKALDLPQCAIADVMSFPVLAVPPDATVEDGARVMCDKAVHRVYVLDAGRPRGVFSTREAIDVVRTSRIAVPIAELMTPQVISLDHGATLGQACEVLDGAGVSGIVVTEHGLAVGVFTEANALAHQLLPADATLEGLFDTSILQLSGRTPAFRAAAFTISTEARRIVVVEPAQHTPCGIVSGLDFARALLGDAPRRGHRRAAPWRPATEPA